MNSDLLCISQASVSVIIKRVSVLLAQQLPIFIYFPRTEREQRQNIILFQNIAGFPSVAGCIDCTHVPILNVGGENAEVFRNRKGYFSLNIQVYYICASVAINY